MQGETVREAGVGGGHGELGGKLAGELGEFGGWRLGLAGRLGGAAGLAVGVRVGGQEVAVGHAVAYAGWGERGFTDAACEGEELFVRERVAWCVGEDGGLRRDNVFSCCCETHEGFADLGIEGLADFS